MEERIGYLAAQALEADGGVMESTVLNRWVSHIGEDIARVCRRRDLRFRFRILASCDVNAIALPGGYVYVYRGLLNRLSSEDELAGVLAHEVAHLHDRDYQRWLKREAVFVAAGLLARKANSGSLNTGLAVVQLLDALRQSRKHEWQADAVGVELAYRAGYDAQGLLEFLRFIASGRGEPSWLDELLATHPQPAERLARATALVQAAEASDFQQTMCVADRLAQRGYGRRAAELYEVAAAIRPTASEPVRSLARLRSARGEWGPALAAYETLLRINPGDPEAVEQARRLRDLSAPTPTPASRPGPPTAKIGALLSETAGASRQTRGRVLRVVDRIAGDQRVRQALTYGQVLDGEWQSLRYVSALAGAWALLRRCLQWPDDALELCWREGELRSGLTRLCDLSTPDLLSPAEPGEQRWLLQVAEPALERSRRGLRRLSTEAETLYDATVQCSVVLLTLLAAGRDDPLGPLNWTRFAVNTAQLASAERRVSRAEEALGDAAGDITAAANAVTEAELDWWGCLASPDVEHPYTALLAGRPGLSTREFAQRWRAEGRLGAAVRRAYQEAAAEGSPWEAREAEFALLRLAGNEVRRENVPPILGPRRSDGAHPEPAASY